MRSLDDRSNQGPRNTNTSAKAETSIRFGKWLENRDLSFIAQLINRFFAYFQLALNETPQHAL